MVRVILLSFIVIIFSLNAQSQHNPTDVVKFRKNLMNLLKYNISSIAQHAKGEVDYIDNIKIYAKSIVDLLEKADHLFIEGTDLKIKESKALEVIWKEREEFKNLFLDSKNSADALLVAVQSENIENIRTSVGKLGKKCGGCHKKYRKKED